jgi:hypothetical protein
MVTTPALVLLPTQLHVDPVSPLALLALDLALTAAQAQLAQVVLSHQVEPRCQRQLWELLALAEPMARSAACPHLAAPVCFLYLLACAQSSCCFWAGPLSNAASQAGTKSFSALLFPAAFDVQKMVMAGLACRLFAGIYSFLFVMALSGRLVVTRCQASHTQLEMLCNAVTVKGKTKRTIRVLELRLLFKY